MGNANMIEMFWMVASICVTVGAIVLTRLWALRLISARRPPYDRELVLIASAWLAVVLCLLAIGLMHGTVGVLITLAPPSTTGEAGWVEEFAREWARLLSLPLLLGAELVLVGMVAAALIYEWRIDLAMRRPIIPKPIPPAPPTNIRTATYSGPDRRSTSRKPPEGKE
jgi:NADH:ubiquinone oxidoreductase subunit 6 (subunit J)